MEISDTRNTFPIDWKFIELIWVLLTRIFEDSGEDFRELGLGVKQVIVLAILDVQNTPRQLRLALGAPASTISNILNELEKKGLIERSIHPDDRRQFSLRRTELGDKVLAKGRASIETMLFERQGSLTNEQLSAIATAKSAMHRIAFGS